MRQDRSPRFWRETGSCLWHLLQITPLIVCVSCSPPAGGSACKTSCIHASLCVHGAQRRAYRTPNTLGQGQPPAATCCRATSDAASWSSLAAVNITRARHSLLNSRQQAGVRVRAPAETRAPHSTGAQAAQSTRTVPYDEERRPPRRFPNKPPRTLAPIFHAALLASACSLARLCSARSSWDCFLSIFASYLSRSLSTDASRSSRARVESRQRNAPSLSPISEYSLKRGQ